MKKLIRWVKELIPKRHHLYVCPGGSQPFWRVFTCWRQSTMDAFIDRYDDLLQKFYWYTERSR